MKWTSAPLIKVAKMLGGGTPSKNRPEFWDGHIPWVSPKDMGHREIRDTEDHITQEAITQSATQVVPAGTVIIVVRSGILVRRFPVSITRVPVALNQDMKALIACEALLPEFLAFFLEASSQKICAQYVKRGATVHSIDVVRLQKLEIPIPPKSEQHRIVSLLNKFVVTKEFRSDADLIAARIVPALFNRSFGGLATSDLRRKALGDLIQLKSGEFLPSREMDTNGIYPVYGGNGVTGYHSKLMFKERTVVIGRVGAYCGVVHYTEPNSWVTDNALYVSEMSPELDPRYLVEALKLANLNQYAGRAGQPLVSAGRIYPIEIPMPPLGGQLKFVQLVNSTEALFSQRAGANERINSLFQVMLQRAVSGDLTENWRVSHQEELTAELQQQRLRFESEAESC